MIEGLILLLVFRAVWRHYWRKGCEEAEQRRFYDEYRNQNGHWHPDDPWREVYEAQEAAAAERAARQAEEEAQKPDSKKARLHQRQRFEVIQGGLAGPAPFSLDEDGEPDPFEED